MPWKQPSPCRVKGCKRLTHTGVCELHGSQTHEPHGTRPSSAVRGYGHAHRKRRAFVLKRDPLCVECLKEGVVRAATEADHTIPLSEGGEDSVDNMQGLCKTHHSRKTARSARAFDH